MSNQRSTTKSKSNQPTPKRAAQRRQSAPDLTQFQKDLAQVDQFKKRATENTVDTVLTGQAMLRFKRASKKEYREEGFVNYEALCQDRFDFE